MITAVLALILVRVVNSTTYVTTDSVSSCADLGGGYQSIETEEECIAAATGQFGDADTASPLNDF